MIAIYWIHYLTGMLYRCLSTNHYICSIIFLLVYIAKHYFHE